MNLFMDIIIMLLFVFCFLFDSKIAMKGQLNVDGYVMDFGDVKNVIACWIFVTLSILVRNVKS